MSWLPGVLVAALMPFQDGSPTLQPQLDLSDGRHVRALHLDTLGRTPDKDELELSASATPRMLVSLLCSSPGFWEHWYEDELQFLLLVDNARPGDGTSGEGLPERLAEGRTSVLDALRELASGSAFHRANPGNDTFVSVVLEQFLGLEVQRQPAVLEAGKRMYDGQRASLFGEQGRSQADVVAIACRQPAFAEVFVARQYERVVGLPASASDVRAWAQRLRDSPRDFSVLVGEWLLSPAYAGRLRSLRPKTDRQFLRGLMVDLTGTVPDAETLSRARTALAAVADAGPLRSVIARVLLASHGAGLPGRGQIQPVPLVDGLYARFLGRTPGVEERARLVLLYEQCDCEPDLLARALMTHWEYQYY